MVREKLVKSVSVLRCSVPTSVLINNDLHSCNDDNQLVKIFCPLNGTKSFATVFTYFYRRRLY